MSDGVLNQHEYTMDCALVLFKQNTAMMLRPIYDWEMRGLLEKNLTD
jgi:hypothetical protein